ncbi:MAG: Ribokinase-like protein [Monoraphidium minutum]|nr:MAG: Ribokinase-like protein [Monoraphidium minutum]
MGRGLWVALGVVACLLAALELSRPDLLIVGNITVDLVDGAKPTGGAVSYAAVAARALGASSCVVTVAGPDAALGVFTGSRLRVVAAAETLTFRHTYTWWGSHRKLQVTANPNVTLGRADVPLWCRRARAVLLGPLTLHDVDAASFVAPEGPLARLLLGAPGPQPVGLMAQGFQRDLGPEGEVLPLAEPSRQLLDGLGPQVSLFLSDVETDAWPPGTLEAVAARTARTLVTRGDKGAHEYGPGGAPPRHHPPVKVEAVDTNGAGDTFATAFMIAAMLGDADPGAAASWAASRAVLQPQSCKPQCAPALIAGGAMPSVTLAGRARLAAAALLQRVGLGGASGALARQGGLWGALEAGLGMLGVRATSAPPAAAAAAAAATA